MHRKVAAYQVSNLAGTSPVEAEILAFGLCIDRLSRARDGKTRIEALAKNHQLWSTLVRDLSSGANGLPLPLRHTLLQLGLWSMAYSNRAIVEDVSLQPLIEVNRNTSEGLRAQVSGEATRSTSDLPVIRSA